MKPRTRRIGASTNTTTKTATKTAGAAATSATGTAIRLASAFGFAATKITAATSVSAIAHADVHSTLLSQIDQATFW